MRWEPRKTAQMLEIEQEFGAPIEVILRRLYIEEGMTLKEVGRELGVTAPAISRWMDLFRIPRRQAQWVMPKAANG